MINDILAKLEARFDPRIIQPDELSRAAYLAITELESENAKLRTCVEELLDFVPYEKPELGPLPNWICKIKARAEAALAKAR